MGRQGRERGRGREERAIQVPLHRHSELDQRVREKGLCLQVAKEVGHLIVM